MRITIGGILLVGGVVAVAVVGPWSNPADLLKQAVDGVTSLVKSVSAPAVIPLSSPVSSENSPSTPVPVTPVVSTSTVVAPPTPAAPVQPVAVVAPVEQAPAPKSAPAIVKVAPEKPARHKHRRSRRNKAVAVKPAKTTPPVPVAASAAKADDSSDPLMGRYVSVKLKSGREVKGVLRERTPQGISLEIPGMGPFQYPNSNIDGVKAAE